MVAIPTNIDDWNESIIQDLIAINYEEDQTVEFKEFLDAPQQKDRKSYKLSLQEEICAFANANGGFILFGIAQQNKKELKIKGVTIPNEVNLKISQILSNTIPTLEFECKQITISRKQILVAQIYEAIDKPVQCANGSFYIRINGGKQPLPRNILMDWFVSKETKRQLIGKLKYEIQHIKRTINELDKLDSSNGVPPFNKLRWKELQDAISKYHYIYSNPNALDIIDRINTACAEISEQEKYFDIEYEVLMKQPWGHVYSDMNGFLSALAPACRQINYSLSKVLRDLKSNIELLEKELKSS